MNLGGDKITLKPTSINSLTFTMPTLPINNIISTNKFLEFLKITCHVNDSIIYGDNDSEIDYDQLKNNKMINNLMGIQNNNNNNSNKNNSIGRSLNENNKKIISSTRRQSILPSSSTPSSSSLSLSTMIETPTSSLNKTDFSMMKTDAFKQNHPLISDKLDEVFNEGILDSVISYICPSYSMSIISPITKTSTCPKQKSFDGTINDKKLTVIESFPVPLLDRNLKKSEIFLNNNLVRLGDSSVHIRDNKVGRKRSLSTSQSNNGGSTERNSESDVIIRVCDEVKNTSKDFLCPQNLLVSKMGYFADVTAGQNLEDMDISVHCDIQIFDWLMKWVKKETKLKCDITPELDANNVIPILVSACFLQMEPLLLDCLSFCHARLNDIVRTSANLSCLNDNIIIRLAAMFTNIELEMVKDKKERVTPRLWTKLITSLCEPEPQALRGHYFTLSGIYRCGKCEKYLTQSVSNFVNCCSSNMRLNRWGQLVSQHIRDTTWDITKYVASLFKELKSWRKVYWKLWGHCHFLYCCLCETHFPVYQMNWCQFHPEPPQYYGPLTEGLAAGPAGRYACCGQQAFRYETLPGPNGCQFREHSVLVETDRDRAILTLAQIVADGGCLYETPIIKKNASTSQASVEPRWVGICLMPTKCRQGLLPALNIDEMNTKLSRRIRQVPACFSESSSETESSDTFVDTNKKTFNRQCSMSSSDGCESEPISPKNFRSRRRRRPQTCGRFWCGESSARSNQDNQREFEERIMKQVVSIVGKNTDNTNKVNKKKTTPNGGTYVRLETEWKDNIKQKVYLKQKQK